MYSVTWIDCLHGIRTVSTPAYLVAYEIHTAMRLSGRIVRLWNKDKSLIA